LDWPDSPDAAPLGDGRNAFAVDRPDSVEALRECVSRRAAEGLAVYPQGGRTALDYGGIPARPGVALDVSSLNSVIDYPAADMTVTVGAGMTLSNLQAVLATEGQFLPIDAPFPERATLGGIYATNTCGPRRFGWGRPRDQIIGVSFVTADGNEVKGGGRVVKNVAGYDFPKLMTGSMGTLGVLTQMTLKVRPKPGASVLVVVRFDRPMAAREAVGRLNTSATRPVAVELLNRAGAELVGLGSANATLVLAFEDNAESVAWQVERVKAELADADVTVLTAAEAASVWAGLTGFAAMEPGPLSFVASPGRSSARSFVDAVPDHWAVRIHAGSGIVHAHALAFLREADLTSWKSLLESFPGMRGPSGSMILTRCPTDWKAELKVWGDRRGDWAIMEKIKAVLDPGAMLNPGRFVGTI
jgi:glycolate oxidase FAD binding subunit